jgi:phosphopantothenoylcysteine decarboxylase/phosphopantothenate--cysteine ligase
VHVVGPERGRLAGGDSGEGRLAEPEAIVAAAAGVLALSGDLVGVKVLVTAGGTREPIDAVRVITNRSSGKQGYAVAEVAARRGAAVTLVTTIGRPAPPAVEIVNVQTAAEMQEAVLARAGDADVIVQAAAVADFRPKEPPEHKLKKDEGVPDIVLEPTHDFSVDLGRAKRPGQVLVGFAAETDDLVANAVRKLESKNLDLIVGNNVAEPDAGFEVDTNRAVILDAEGGVEPLPLQSKTDLAGAILDRVHALLEKRRPQRASE